MSLPDLHTAEAEARRVVYELAGLGSAAESTRARALLGVVRVTVLHQAQAGNLKHTTNYIITVWYNLQVD